MPSYILILSGCVDLNGSAAILDDVILSSYIPDWTGTELTE